MTNPGATQDDAAIVEVEKLRAIEHAAWHALDDSGELASGDVIITKDNFAALCSLLLREQQAEIARLRAENERLAQERNSALNQCTELHARCRELEQETP